MAIQAQIYIQRLTTFGLNNTIFRTLSAVIFFPKITDRKDIGVVVYMLANIASIVALFVGLAISLTAQPAKAGLFDFLKIPVIVCQPQDRPCIAKAALDIAIKDFKSRNPSGDSSHHAERAGRLAALFPEPQQASVRQQWKDAGADDDFFERMDETTRALMPTNWLTVAVLEDTLNNEEAPDGSDFEKFLEFAFPVVLKKDPKTALSLWNDHLDLIWDQAFSAVTLVFDWMVDNDLDALDAYASRYNLPKSALFDPRDKMSSAAANYCARGEPDKGQRILALLEQEKEQWKPDREMKAIDWARMTAGVLGCRGEDAALAMIDPVLSQMQTDLDDAKRKYPEETQQKFVIGVIRSEVAEEMIEPLTLHLQRSGRHEQAIRIFSRLPAQQSSMTLGDVSSKGIYGMEFPEQSFAEFMAMHVDDAFYGADENRALEWFITDYKIADTGVERETEAIDKATKVWPSPLARQAAEQALATLEEKAKQQPNSEQSALDLARLKLGAIERHRRGCLISDATLSQFLSNASIYEFGEQRTEMLIEYLTYLDTETAGKNDGDCLIK